MAEEAVNVIYALAEHPDLICRNMFVEFDAAIKEFINSQMEVDGAGDKGMQGTGLSYSLLYSGVISTDLNVFICHHKFGTQRCISAKVFDCIYF